MRSEGRNKGHEKEVRLLTHVRIVAHFIHKSSAGGELNNNHWKRSSRVKWKRDEGYQLGLWCLVTASHMKMSRISKFFSPTIIWINRSSGCGIVSIIAHAHIFEGVAYVCIATAVTWWRMRWR